MKLKNTFLLRHNNPSFDAYAAYMKKRVVGKLNKSDTKTSLDMTGNVETHMAANNEGRAQDIQRLLPFVQTDR